MNNLLCKLRLIAQPLTMDDQPLPEIELTRFPTCDGGRNIIVAIAAGFRQSGSKQHGVSGGFGCAVSRVRADDERGVAG